MLIWKWILQARALALSLTPAASGAQQGLPTFPVALSAVGMRVTKHPSPQSCQLPCEHVQHGWVGQTAFHGARVHSGLRATHQPPPTGKSVIWVLSQGPPFIWPGSYSSKSHKNPCHNTHRLREALVGPAELNMPLLLHGISLDN